MNIEKTKKYKRLFPNTPLNRTHKWLKHIGFIKDDTEKLLDMIPTNDSNYLHKPITEETFEKINKRYKEK